MAEIAGILLNVARPASKPLVHCKAIGAVLGLMEEDGEGH